MYGCLRKDIYVFTPNFSGFLIGFSSACIFMINDSNNHQFPTVSYTASFSCLILTLMFSVLNKIVYIGVLGNFLAVIVLGSPLATLKTVFERKSTASMPFSTSLLCFLNALAWVLYGVVVVNDPLIYTPNLCGCILSLVQLIMFCVFGIANENADELDSLEEKYAARHKYYQDQEFHYDYSSTDRTDDEQVSECENEC